MLLACWYLSRALPKEHLTITGNSLLTLTSDIMPPGPFSGLLAPFIGVGRKAKKYEKLQTEDPEKKRQEATQEEINRLHSKIVSRFRVMIRGKQANSLMLFAKNTYNGNPSFSAILLTLLKKGLLLTFDIANVKIRSCLSWIERHESWLNIGKKEGLEK